VTLFANGEAIATVTASQDGQWSAVVTRRFPPGPLELAIAADNRRGGSARGPILTVIVPKGSGLAELTAAPARSRPILPSKAPPGGSRALGELAALVERARASSGQDKESAARGPAVVPVPITFVTGEATMTPEGLHAADLLVEYVRIMAPKAMTLSGHADVRGGDAYNVELSRQRLEAIERHLRSNGYAGRLSLLPKGKSEPFMGIDRHTATHEAILQADRRVELRLVE
jgi:outer membrane protein OmpA-like peptidoglycan-associated protein